MIHIIKNYKWIIATSLICIIFGTLTFLSFINQNFLGLNNINFKILLFFDVVLVFLFVIFIIFEISKIVKDKKKGNLGAETSLRYLTFFSTTILFPSIIIAIFSLLLFNVGIQKYFDKKIKSVVNNASEVGKNYVEQSRNSIEADILLMSLDLNNKSGLFYDNPKRFLRFLTTQRLFRKLDEVHMLDSSGNIIMTTVTDSSIDFVTPLDDAFEESLGGKPVKYTDPSTNRTSALVKLSNYIDTYLYVVKFLDPAVINYIKETDQAVSFYYSVQDSKTGIKITFAIIYILIVSLLLFLSIIVSINFVSKLTKPIINLIGASEKISEGDLNAKVPKIETDKEFEMLNENFNSMIDKLKLQQDKLLLSERHLAWENVARKLAHEIKNPLTPIQLSIDRLREKYLDKVGKDSEKFTNYLNTINKQIKDIEKLVNEFSDFARMPKPIIKKINIIDIADRTLKLYELSDPSIEFIFSTKKKNLSVNADQEQLNRVFLNLVKNSVESIKEKRNKNVDFKGKINVDIRDNSDYIYITINDNGVGFSGIDKKKMLTPYFTTKKEGTGLGLAIVGKIINDHNGEILLNSEYDGAMVEIKIPN